MTACDRAFEEELLSGFVDDVLTQGEGQRVRLHLETCASCRELVEELARHRSAALSTRFRVPEDRQWDESPRSFGGGLTRSAGWLLVLIWAIATGGFGLWQLGQSGAGWFEKMIVFGGLSGFTLLLVSVLLDRLHDLKTDRYQRVEK